MHVGFQCTMKENTTTSSFPTTKWNHEGNLACARKNALARKTLHHNLNQVPNSFQSRTNTSAFPKKQHCTVKNI